MRVAVVEDDVGLAQAIVESLQLNHVPAEWMSRGGDVLGRHRDFDVVVLDLGLPDEEGLVVLRRLREVSAVPVIVLTARSDERTVVRGLRSGADDYLVKPARTTELLARIETVLRRSAQAPTTETRTDVRSFGDIEIAIKSRTVRVAGQPINLTPTEFALLSALTEDPGAVMGRTRLMDQVWGNAFLGTSRSLDVHIAGLRGKLGRRDAIETVRGVGFRWAG